MRTAALAIVLSVSAVAAPAQEPELAIALVRPDGILTPFAVFDGGKWIDAWPEPLDDRRIDRMIEALPSYWRERRRQTPRTWHVAGHPSHQQTAIQALTPVVFDEHCGTQTGLLTDRQRSGTDAHEKTFATSRAMTVEWPIDVLRAPNRAPWQPLLTEALAEAGRQELRALAEQQELTGRRLDLDLAADRTPPAITRAYGFEENDRRMIYYEVERRYAKPLFARPDAERAAVKVSGWIIAAGRANPRAFESRASIGDVEFKDFVSSTPLGIIRPAGTAVWVMQEHAYESESVSLLHVRADGIHRVLTKFIGGC